jgi:hypothetical protein
VHGNSGPVLIGVGTSPALLLIAVHICISVGFYNHEGKDQVCDEEMDISKRRRIRKRHMHRYRQFLELERKRGWLLR